MRQPFRLLVTGSRTWYDVGTLEQALAVILDRHPEGVLLVQGACPRGADAIAVAYADRTPGYRTEAHPADWSRYGRGAVYRRNAEMIALGADGCAAFIRGASPGGTNTVRLAREAGMPVWLHTRPGPKQTRMLPNPAAKPATTPVPGRRLGNIGRAYSQRRMVLDDVPTPADAWIVLLGDDPDQHSYAR
jgi:YspA, cpYpsA-related SLOG family